MVTFTRTPRSIERTIPTEAEIFQRTDDAGIRTEWGTQMPHAGRPTVVRFAAAAANQRVANMAGFRRGWGNFNGRQGNGGNQNPSGNVSVSVHTTNDESNLNRVQNRGRYSVGSTTHVLPVNVANLNATYGPLGDNTAARMIDQRWVNVPYLTGNQYSATNGVSAVQAMNGVNLNFRNMNTNYVPVVNGTLTAPAGRRGIPINTENFNVMQDVPRSGDPEGGYLVNAPYTSAMLGDNVAYPTTYGMANGATRYRSIGQNTAFGNIYAGNIAHNLSMDQYAAFANIPRVAGSQGVAVTLGGATNTAAIGHGAGLASNTSIGNARIPLIPMFQPTPAIVHAIDSDQHSAEQGTGINFGYNPNAGYLFCTLVPLNPFPYPPGTMIVPLPEPPLAMVTHRCREPHIQQFPFNMNEIINGTSSSGGFGTNGLSNQGSGGITNNRYTRGPEATNGTQSTLLNPGNNRGPISSETMGSQVYGRSGQFGGNVHGIPLTVTSVDSIPAGLNFTIPQNSRNITNENISIRATEALNNATQTPTSTYRIPYSGQPPQWNNEIRPFSYNPITSIQQSRGFNGIRYLYVPDIRPVISGIPYTAYPVDILFPSRPSLELQQNYAAYHFPQHDIPIRTPPHFGLPADTALYQQLHDTRQYYNASEFTHSLPSYSPHVYQQYSQLSPLQTFQTSAMGQQVPGGRGTHVHVYIQTEAALRAFRTPAPVTNGHYGPNEYNGVSDLADSLSSWHLYSPVLSHNGDFSDDELSDHSTRWDMGQFSSDDEDEDLLDLE